MKKLALIYLVFMINGCSTSTSEVTNDYSLPNGISDCNIYQMDSEKGTRLYVVRCPLSECSTTYTYGKMKVTTTTIERDTVGLGEYKRLKEKFDGK